MQKFRNNHGHTEDSNFKISDSIIKVEDYIDWSIRYGYNGCTLTDHEALSGSVRFIKRYQELKRGEDPDLQLPDDFKIGLGNEIYLMSRHEAEEAQYNYQRGITKFWHFILIAKNRQGFEQLKRLSSSAYGNWWKAYGQARVPTLEEDLVDIIGENKGNLIASSACLGGKIPQWILQIEQGDMEAKKKINDYINWCTDVFGKENFFLEIQPCEKPFYEEENAFGEVEKKTHEQVIVNRWLIKIAKALGLRWQVTCDSHYIGREDLVVQDAFLNSDEDGKGNRETADFYASAHMWKPDELYENLCLFLDKEDVIKAFEGTQAIHEMLEDYDLYHDVVIPEDKKVPEHIKFKRILTGAEVFNNFYNSPNKQDRYLIHLIEEGMLEHGTWEKKEYVARVAKELTTIWDVSVQKQQSLGAYYVMVRNIIHHCIWPISLVGPGRGSACGFYISRAIGITQVDPVYWGMPDWRHLDKERPELPDIDIDSEQSKRQAILQNMQEYFGFDNVLNCCTFTTLKSKQAILTACRGLGIDNDVAQAIASIVPFERGSNWPIRDCLYGNDDMGRLPVTELKNEFARYDGLERVVLQLEGLITGVSIHASAVYIFSNGYIELNSLMRAPNGAYVTAFNMGDSDYCGGLKFDSLTIKNLDCIHNCIDLLIQDGYLEDKGSVKANYDAYAHPDAIDIEDPEAWRLLNEKRVLSAFQYDTQMGVTAIETIQPTNIRELALGNSLMRLMGEDGEDTPLQKYAKNKTDIENWYAEMRAHNLSAEDIQVLEPHLLAVKGVCAEQEGLMTVSMDEKISGFNTVEANTLRKAVAKKKRKVLKQAEEMFFNKGHKLGTSQQLLDYVWYVQFKMQWGYAFSFLHSLAYSYICCQEMHLANKFPIEYWNCAVLSVNAAIDEDSNKTTNYGVIASTIGSILEVGGKVELPAINKAEIGFKPLPADGAIVFALKGISGVNDQITKAIISNRPYVSFDDFYAKMQAWKEESPENKIGDSVIITLIKAGCFDEMEDRMALLQRFIRLTSEPLNRLSWTSLPELQRAKLIPDRYAFQVRLVNFRKWLYGKNEPSKKEGKSQSTWFYSIPTNILPFYEAHVQKVYDEFEKASPKKPSKVIDVKDVANEGETLVKRGIFDKAIDSLVLDLKRDVINSQEMLDKLNEARYQERWAPHNTSLSRWEMESVNYYAHEHELAGVDDEFYHISPFNQLPREGKVLEWKKWGEKEIPRWQLYKIWGTVLDKDKNKHIVTLLTPEGVVSVKFYKGQFGFYDAQISEVDNDGKKTVLEKSWFKRGTRLLITGFRREDQFVARRYANSLFRHSVQLIEGVDGNRLILKSERTGAEEE